MLNLKSCLLVTVIACSLAGCGGKSSTNGNAQTQSQVQNDNSPRTNAEELGMIINLPYEAEDIVWKEYPSQKKLVAVFKFSAADAAKVTSEASAYGAPQSVTILSEPWFPEELIAQAEMSGDSTVKATAYPANVFFMEPYSTGRIAQVEGGGGYFVLELSKK